MFQSELGAQVVHIGVIARAEQFGRLQNGPVYAEGEFLAQDAKEIAQNDVEIVTLASIEDVLVMIHGFFNQRLVYEIISQKFYHQFGVPLIFG